MKVVKESKYVQMLVKEEATFKMISKKLIEVENSHYENLECLLCL